VKYTVDSIIFDFDGVILESNHVRTEGFKLLLEGRKYDADTVARFIRFHEKNAGLSRYYKLRYLFYEILNQPGEFLRYCISHGVGDVDHGGPGVYYRLYHLAQEFGFGP